MWQLLHVPFLVPRILKRILDFFFLNLWTPYPDTVPPKVCLWGISELSEGLLGGPKNWEILIAVSHSFADGRKPLGDFLPRTDSLSRAQEYHRPVCSGVTLNAEFLVKKTNVLKEINILLVSLFL